METINHSLFIRLNASEQPHGLSLVTALFFAQYVVWCVPIMVAITWLMGGENLRKILLIAIMSVLIGLLINVIIRSIWPHPRPFVVGIGHTYLFHAADASFPSNHLTFMWAFALSIVMHRTTRSIGIAFILLGIPVAWARIYLGVHFPFDMFGSAICAVISVWLSTRLSGLYLKPAYAVAITIHRVVFRKFIILGWVQQ